MTTLDTGADPDVQRPNPFVRLYRGETAFDFVGRRRWWYLLSGIVVVAGLVSLGTRGFDLGIDFKGGTSWQVPAHGVTASQATSAVQGAGVTPSLVQVLGTGSHTSIEVQANLNHDTPTVRQAVENTVADTLARVTHSSAADARNNVNEVGPTWGSEITKKAVIAVIVFFVVVVAYISLRFEWKMAVAALVAVLHDLLVVAGVYSLVGLQVTPDTVVAVLTILGYSLYDTVVVFDRVRDNTKGFGASGRMTYQDVVNLSMNQTLARSINTSLVAILPVLSVLVVGAEILGATTLQYFGFALLIGLLSGAYSSIFIASPLLSSMKEHEPRYQSIRAKLDARAERGTLLTPRAAALQSASGAGPSSQRRSGAARGTSSKRPGQIIRPGAASGAVVDDAVVDGAAGVADVADAGANGSPSRPQAPARRPSPQPARRPLPRKKSNKKGGRRR